MTKCASPGLIESGAWLSHATPQSQAIHAGQGSVRAIEQRDNGVAEDVFGTRPPRVAPDAFEHSDDPAGDEVPFIRRYIGGQIEANGEVEIAGMDRGDSKNVG